jgi:hypothetical protein
MKLEKITIHMGYAAAHGHGGTLGQGLAARPMLAAFGSPCHWSVSGVRLASARCKTSVHRRTVNGTIKHHQRHGHWQSHHHYSGYTLLQ